MSFPLAKLVLIYGKLKKVDDAVQIVTKYLESIETTTELETVATNNPVAEEVKQMLADLKSAKKKSSKPKKVKEFSGKCRR